MLGIVIEDPKGQNVRLLDVFVIGPLMIWAGRRLKDEPGGSLLTLAGIGTIAFNYANYRRLKKQRTAAEPSTVSPFDPTLRRQ